MNSSLIVHNLIVLSELPLTIFEFGNMANVIILETCPVKLAIHSNGDSDCHILIDKSKLPQPLTIFEFGSMANAFIQSVCPIQVAIN